MQADQVARSVVTTLAGAVMTFGLWWGASEPIDDVQEIRASLVTAPVGDSGERMEVRITFQRIVWNTDGDVTDDVMLVGDYGAGGTTNTGLAVETEGDLTAIFVGPLTGRLDGDAALVVDPPRSRLDLEERVLLVGKLVVILDHDVGCCPSLVDVTLADPQVVVGVARRGLGVDEDLVGAGRFEVGRERYDGHYSSSRTCEIAMTRATGRSYRSFWHLLEETTR